MAAMVRRFVEQRDRDKNFYFTKLYDISFSIQGKFSTAGRP
jgi:hypothetical protein